MELGLEEKVVMVAGATRGFGRACVDVFVQEGARLALVARTPSELARVAEESSLGARASISTYPADLTDPGEPDRVVQEVAADHGRIDALVNTVGTTTVSRDGSLGEDALWEEAFQSILMVAVRLCRAVVPVMVSKGTGAIVNTSAMSIRHYLSHIAHYSAQKAALAHFTKNLALEYARQGIRVNAICPGWIASEQVEQMIDRALGVVAAPPDEMLNRGWTPSAVPPGATRQDVWEALNAERHFTTFSGRMGDPVEYARVAAFLCSDAASYVNGAIVNVDGGSQF